MPGEEGREFHAPEDLSLDQFLSGTIDIIKLNEYILSGSHRKGHHKAKLWNSVFGIGERQGDLLKTLIVEQLSQVEEIWEREPISHLEDIEKLTRRFTLDIPDFRGPNGNVARVRTNWALDPGKDVPHLSSAFPHPTGEQRRRRVDEGSG